MCVTMPAATAGRAPNMLIWTAGSSARMILFSQRIRRPGVIIVIPESTHGVYWGPYSSQPRDHETTLDCKFYLNGLAFCKKGDTLYVLAEETER